MNKSELIQALAEKSNIDPTLARDVVETTIAMMKQQLMEGGRIEIRGFGVFEMREYGAYKGRNPSTGESVDVKAKRTPFFKCGKELRDLLNEGKYLHSNGNIARLNLTPGRGYDTCR
ncbi:MAG: integration host factor subunit beta [Mailhella sp.]|nr:integration host factor subunit beta [Mailhella sp.]